MIKKFTKRQLLDQYGFTVEEVLVIMEYQKKLPILVENDTINGFCVNARDLWIQLNKPQGQFTNWTKRKLINKKTKSELFLFVKNKDYSTITQKCEIANTGGFKDNIDFSSFSQISLNGSASGIIARCFQIIRNHQKHKNNL